MLKTLFEYGYNAYEQMKKAELAKVTGVQPAVPLPQTGPAEVLLSGEPVIPVRKPTLAVSQLRFNLGQETAQLQQMLRKKLAEAGIPQGTQIQLRKTEIGTLSVEARVSTEMREKLENVLNQSSEMRIQFNRISQHKPAVEFITNATRLQKVYGADNIAMQTVVSGDDKLNSLQDITQRLQQLRHTQGQKDLLADSEKPFEMAVSI